MKKKNVIDLIKYHYEKNDSAFRNASNKIAVEFDKNGDSQLAEYIMSLISDANVSMLQPVVVKSSYLKKLKTNTPSLFLPKPIADDILGIVNAIKRHFGINKFLFEGESGTGKTESAKQVARLLKCSLYSVDFTQIIDSKMGQTAKNISHVFNEIDKLASSTRTVFLFDEIDAIALDRINSNDIREMGRVTSNVLQALDNINDNAVILATTNLYGCLDKAFKRRFDAIISFDRYSSADLIKVAVSLLDRDLKKFPSARKEMKLFKKILNTPQSLPKPGDLKNLIKVSLAFSDPSDSCDYLLRIYKALNPEVKLNISTSRETLKAQGFTGREIDILTD